MPKNTEPVILQKNTKHLSIDDQRESVEKIAPECSGCIVVDKMADREDVPFVDTISDESIQQEDIEPETECEEKLLSLIGALLKHRKNQKWQKCYML